MSLSFTYNHNSKVPHLSDIAIFYPYVILHGVSGLLSIFAVSRLLLVRNDASKLSHIWYVHMHTNLYTSIHIHKHKMNTRIFTHLHVLISCTNETHSHSPISHNCSLFLFQLVGWEGVKKQIQLLAFVIFLAILAMQTIVTKVYNNATITYEGLAKGYEKKPIYI